MLRKSIIELQQLKIITKDWKNKRKGKIEKILMLPALCGIYPEKLAKKAKMNLKKFKKLNMQFDRQQNSTVGFF